MTWNIKGTSSPEQTWRSSLDTAATRSPTDYRLNARSSVLPQKARPMKQEMLINVAQPEECRIAIVEDGVLEELTWSAPDRTAT